MTTASAPSAPALAKKPHDPSYEFGRREAEVVARFPSGKRVAVVRGRDRSYPGLRSVAPSSPPRPPRSAAVARRDRDGRIAVASETVITECGTIMMRNVAE